MSIFTQIGNRLLGVVILFIGGLVAWSIVIIILIPLMFIVIPLVWIAVMVATLARGVKFN